MDAPHGIGDETWGTVADLLVDPSPGTEQRATDRVLIAHAAGVIADLPERARQALFVGMEGFGTADAYAMRVGAKVEDLRMKRRRVQADLRQVVGQ